jgi:hypothetical protein
MVSRCYARPRCSSDVKGSIKEGEGRHAGVKGK